MAANCSLVCFLRVDVGGCAHRCVWVWVCGCKSETHTRSKEAERVSCRKKAPTVAPARRAKAGTGKVDHEHHLYSSNAFKYWNK